MELEISNNKRLHNQGNLRKLILSQKWLLIIKGFNCTWGFAFTPIEFHPHWDVIFPSDWSKTHKTCVNWRVKLMANNSVLIFVSMKLLKSKNMNNWSTILVDNLEDDRKIESNYSKLSLFHLVCALFLVVLEVRSICTVLQLVFSDPLVGGIPSLACHMCQCNVLI